MIPSLEQRHALGGRLCPNFGGGGGSSSSSSSTTTNNTDARMAVQDGIGITNSTGNNTSFNSTDAVKAIAQMGADTIAKTGEAVVFLNQSTTAANVTAWDKTVSAGAGLVDKLIDATTEQIKSGQRATEQIAEKGFAISQSAISSFQPSENKASDTSLKLGMIAAAAVAATILLRKAK